jgi:hypothetical protein
MANTNSTNNRTLWEGRSSPLLFIYAYIGILFIAYLLQKFVGGKFFIYATPGIIYFAIKARSMRYAITKKDIYFSKSLGDDEEITVPLGDIQAIQVVDRQPWKLLGLGTVILITNPDKDMQPCMKCLPSPHALARNIRISAQALGSPGFPIETV